MSKYITDDIKMVAFDFDDTLVGTRVPIWNLHRHVAKKHYNIELDDETLLKHWGQPVDVLAKYYYQTDDIEQGVAHIFKDGLDFPKETLAQTMPALKKLKKADKVVGIVTASHLAIVEIDTKLAGIDMNLIDYLQTADDTEVHKPNSTVFIPMLTWAKKHNIEASEILYIGDGLHDLQAATGAGLNFLGVTTGLVTKEDFAAQGAPSIADLSFL